MKLGGESASLVGSGGMRTKLLAAKIAGKFGVDTIITSGKELNPIAKLFAGKKTHTIICSN